MHLIHIIRAVNWPMGVLLQYTHVRIGYKITIRVGSRGSGWAVSLLKSGTVP
jgi:hypothetical protein